MIFEPGQEPGPPTRVGCAVLLVLAAGLVALLVPAVQKVRRSAERLRCAGHLCQLSLSLHSHADQHRTLPAGTAPHPSLPPDDRLSWYVAVLPYTDTYEDQLAKRFDLAAGWDAPANRGPAAVPLSRFRCAATAVTTPVCHYVGVAGVGADAAALPAGDARAGAFGYDRRRTLDRNDFPDGTSNTLLLVDDGRDPGPWAGGGSATVRGVEPAAGPPGVLHWTDQSWTRRGFDTVAARADGSYRVFGPGTDPAVWAALATAAGGESLPAD